MRRFFALAALVALALPMGVSAAPLDQGAVQASALQVYGDTVLGLPRTGPPPPCVPQTRFTAGDQIVWRARVVDPVTGQAVREGTVEVVLANGNTLPMTFGPHPPVGAPTDDFWTATWTIPADASLGILRYSIRASASGRSGSFEPFNVEATLLTIVPVP